MVIGMGLVLIGVLALLVAGAWGLRSLGRSTAATEAHLHDPHTSTVAYVVPEGQDPVPLMAELSLSGFVSVVDTSGGAERLLVECSPAQRSQVREVIGHVAQRDIDGTVLPAARVRFEDEA
ncbi:hypothetical protein FB382_004039 [Nocardioides ginsengisegetis]|uniref:Uncharacterized protein n=1 Tax=Nocardioides ginsengisegetis TaxID=661491 RepID=A0A7W3PBQ8_9ACTN|nr:hypothetical protein [Nocardioides ginsengisegetis]MBA8805694.1 hypothetical protein [Nocardioides ginsengisegetis]